MQRKLRLICLSMLMIPAILSANANAVPTGSVERYFVTIAASHAGEAIKWYSKHLPCSPLAERSNGMSCAGVTIDIIERQSLGSSQGTSIDHIAFSYPDLESKMAELEGIGVGGSGVRLQRFEDGSTFKTVEGLYQHGFIFDPWGTRIKLIEETGNPKFHHVQMLSANPDETLIWYQNLLGLEPTTFKPGKVGLNIAGIWLFIGPHPNSKPAMTQERAIDHLGFVQKNLSSTFKTLKAKNTDISTPTTPKDAVGKAQRSFVVGPDSTPIAMVESGWAGISPATTRDDNLEVELNETSYQAPTTPWGEPDFQGMWTGNAAHGIPLERPIDSVNEKTLTAEQAAARRERGTLRSIWGYEREWRDTTLGYVKSSPSRQVAMIIDPPNGRLPAMTTMGEELAEEAKKNNYRGKIVDGPEDLSNWVRCITRGSPPGLMMPGVYNNGLQIVQSPGYMAVQKEMIHETRIIPTINSEVANTGDVTQWLGQSSGQWEGDTLVVTVQGFNGRAPYKGAGKNLTLTERYRRTGPETLEYQFTVDDPSIWTRPWTGKFNFVKDDSQYELVEYACHEGNYGMTNILSAARSKDKQNSDPAGG